MLEFKSYFSSSSGNLNSLYDGKTLIMIDCGVSWKKAKASFNFKTSEIAAACITHSHNDHSRGVKDAAMSGLDVYLLPETKAELGLSGHRLHEIKIMEDFRIGTFTIKAFPLEHDVPICGFLLASDTGEKAVYITDSFYCRYRFNGLTMILIECNYAKGLLPKDIHPAQRKRLLRSHMSLETLLKLLAANDLSKVREIHLLHLSDDNSDEQLFKDTIQSKTGIPVYVASS